MRHRMLVLLLAALALSGQGGGPVLSVPGGAAGGGDNIQINGTAVTDANFNDSTPAAVYGSELVKWQRSGSGPDNASLQRPRSVKIPNLIRWAVGIPEARDINPGVVTIQGDSATLVGLFGLYPPTSTEHVHLDITNAAMTIGDDGGVSGNLNWHRSHNPVFIYRGGAPDTTNVRNWAGFTDQTLATQAASDNPAGNHAAFRFSTDAGDSFWMACTKDGTTQSCTSTGIVPSSTIRRWEIRVLASSVEFWIDGSLNTTKTTNLPSAVPLRYVMGGETRANDYSINAKFAWFYVQSSL